MIPPRRATRSQAAVEFLVTYGFSILIISIAVFAILQLGIFDYSNTPQYCYSQAPFSCVAYSINTKGAMSLVLSQSSGGTLTVSGVACATAPNAIKSGPEYGNQNVLPYNTISGSSAYYPNSNLANGIVMNPGTQVVFYFYCYAGGQPQTGAIGDTFTGYIWVNYTFPGLPSTYHNIVRLASISAKYVGSS